MNEEVLELRLRNKRLEKEIVRLNENKNVMTCEVLESLIIDVFELVMISKTIDTTEKFHSLMDLLKERSRTVMIKLNPLVGLFQLEDKMKENGFKLKDQILNMTKSPKYNVSTLLQNIHEDKALQPKMMELSTLSKLPSNNSGLQDFSQRSDFMI